MVCKEDVVSWFKELESYKRIDTMCTLLNMCLPFELRFIGTYLEELGKRDFQELRGAELRANNPTDLATDIGGANTDPRTRRKMALYVSLLRSCNFACATTLYNAMVSLEQSGLLKGLYGDLLEEILLLYTMALHHPAFTFDQKSHFGEILDKLKVEEQQQRPQFQEPPEHMNMVPANTCLAHPSVTPNMSIPPPSLSGIAPPPGLVFVKSAGVQGPPTNPEGVSDLGSPPVLAGGGVGVGTLLSDVTHPPGLPLPQYNVADFVVGQTTWPANLIVSSISQPLEVISYTAPPTTTSPLVSSPGDSRAGSPRVRRRPSRDRSPPTIGPSASPAPPTPLDPPPIAQLTSNLESLSMSEMRQLRDETLRELGFPSNAVMQLRSVEKMNGVKRQSMPHYPPPRSSSDSGSSATSSPPGTPAPAPRRLTPAGPGPAPSAPPHIPYLYPRGFAAYPTPSAAYRPPPPPFANGEPTPYASAGHYAGFVPVLYAPPKLSCWNCGGSGHAGHECKEPSMEEMTRAGGYQLDFGGAPPEPGEKWSCTFIPDSFGSELLKIVKVARASSSTTKVSCENVNNYLSKEHLPVTEHEQ
ncbi:Zinc finger CCHC domain-containing protein 2 [Eumeta japonica]|uniref:Zinc finger CCHC domain-containing protein 2 n=1 Tax=Eumeta variegata TaxID=151549 RepID=A0A4C1WDH3_EUMVA|nr:Zinc finger CCHC domain-containing protein 2 [Eumeta japonica]